MPDPAESVGLVLDTSVWINLLATDAMEAILGALAVPCYAPEQVVTEVRRHPATGTAFPMESHPLRQMSPKVSILSLEGNELDLFLEIVGAPSGDALGDGEAAAIVVAASRGLDLIVDDRKARQILREEIQPTTHLLDGRSAASEFGCRRSWSPAGRRMFARACRFGRMHVPRS